LGKAILNVLSKSEAQAIHNATLKVLETSGLKVPSKRALDILNKAGARVDYKKEHVIIPEHVIKEALKKAPKTFNYGARNPKYEFALDKTATHICTDGYAVFIRDFKTGERRYSTNEDLARWAVLADSLSAVHVFWPSVAPTDVPEPMQRIQATLTAFSNTGKHVEFYGNNAKEARYEIEIASAIVGGEKELRKRPIFSAVLCPIAPCGYQTGLIEAAIEYSKAGIPIVPLAMPMAGQTGPVTIAGTLVVNNAEVLGNLVISEFASPGAPVLYAGCPGGIDPKTGAYRVSPEGDLINAALTSLARYYDLPCEISGGSSDSKIPDAQAGYDRAIGLVTTILTGPDVLTGFGGLETSNVMCPELLIIDNEIAEIALRFARGFEVNKDTLAVDVIRKVGPGGHFMAEKHTLNHLRTEYWIPKLSDRQTFDVWVQAGAKDIVTVAKEKVKEILATHKPEPIPKDIQKEISQIMKRCEKELLSK